MNFEYPGNTDTMRCPHRCQGGQTPVFNLFKEKTMEERKHSKLGVASFIISVVSAIALLVIIILAAYFVSQSMDENSIEMIAVGLFMFLFIGISCVALGLGIAGLVQKNVNKIFAILGTIFSAVSVLGMIALITLGLSMQ
jgi:hypothetical protein